MEPRYASLVIEGLKRARVRFVVGLPDSLLAGLYAAADEDPDIKYVSVTRRQVSFYAPHRATREDYYPPALCAGIILPMHSREPGFERVERLERLETAAS